MDAKQLNAKLRRWANADLKLAEKQGSTSICQTKLGRVDVEYQQNGVYSLTSKLGEFIGDKKHTVDFIVSNVYDVVEG